jgi:aminoglycoside phosphotransferase (APT) family kinase protein
VFGVPKLFREMPCRLARLMAELHALPVGDLAYDGTATALDDVAPGRIREWMEANAPAPVPPVVVHGDLHGANLLVARDQVTGVLDWELATIAPPEFDVARTACILALLPGVVRAAQRLLVGAGRRSAHRFVDAHASRHPLDRERLRWYEVLHAARLLAVGRRQGRVSELWAPLIPALERRILERTGVRER